MNKLSFYSKLNLMKDKDYIENFLTVSTSLIIAGVKPAITLTLNKQDPKIYTSWNKFGKCFLKNISLKYINLKSTTKSDIILIYCENLLTTYLNKNSHLEFLFKLGYSKTFKLSIYLETLKDRYLKYKCPHELGLFLGIPIEDVNDFMNCSSKNCLLCGYWKVYNNLDKAILTFKKYDMVREFAIRHILKGNLAHNLAIELKSSFHTL